LNRYKYFCQILNVNGIKDVGQTEMYTAEPLEHEPTSFEKEIATEKLKTYKSPRTNQILAELIKQEVKHYTLRPTNINSIWNNKKLPQP